MRLHLARPASLVLLVATLLPAAARAQSVAESAGADLVAGALPRTCLSCGGFLPQRRLEPPAREVSLRVGATLVGQGLAGPGVAYGRQLSDAIAIEGALDLASGSGGTGVALLQLPAAESPLVSRSRFVTVGVARIINADETMRRQGARATGLALGGGHQTRVTDSIGARVEAQVLALGRVMALRVSVGAFVGFGER